jgi:hypothetical protein
MTLAKLDKRTNALSSHTACTYAVGVSLPFSLHGHCCLNDNCVTDMVGQSIMLIRANVVQLEASSPA